MKSRTTAFAATAITNDKRGTCSSPHSHETITISPEICNCVSQPTVGFRAFLLLLACKSFGPSSYKLHCHPRSRFQIFTLFPTEFLWKCSSIEFVYKIILVPTPEPISNGEATRFQVWFLLRWKGSLVNSKCRSFLLLFFIEKENIR